MTDKFNALEPIFKEIGLELADIVGGNPDDIFLYVEVGDRWISPNVFNDEGRQIRNIDGSRLLSDLLWEAWYTGRHQALVDHGV